jgi:hypothetical protein
LVALEVLAQLIRDMPVVMQETMVDLVVEVLAEQGQTLLMETEWLVVLASHPQ